MDRIEELCRGVSDYVIALRRRLHRIPELGIHNPQTQALICAELDAMGIPYQINPVIHDGVQDTSVVAFIQGGSAERVIALRADVDALPVQEQLAVDYRSAHPGQMHACGHDCHCAMLLGAAKVLWQLRGALNGSVKLIFQSGEEVITGARLVIQGGFLKSPDVSACLGLHVWPLPQFAPGTIVVRPGCMMASGNRFQIRVSGQGSHGSQPALGRDPIACAAQIYSALQCITARELPGDAPRVMSVCQLHAGSAWNIIPADAWMEGTIRATDPQTQQFYQQRIGEIVTGVAKAMRCQGVVDWIDGTPPVMNDPELTAMLAQAAEQALGPQAVSREIGPSMGNEDFAHYQALVPGVFAFLNISNSDPATHCSLHSPTFQVDERVLWRGTALHVLGALRYLA